MMWKRKAKKGAEKKRSVLEQNNSKQNRLLGSSSEESEALTISQDEALKIQEREEKTIPRTDLNAGRGGIDPVDIVISADLASAKTQETARMIADIEKAAGAKKVSSRSFEGSEERTTGREEFLKMQDREGKTIPLTDPNAGRGEINPVDIVMSADLAAARIQEKARMTADIEKGSDVEKAPPFWKPAGWLVCIEGPDFGKSYPLRVGKNRIGRYSEMDVSLSSDSSVLRKDHAWIEYQDEGCQFFVGTDNNSETVSLNRENLVQTALMQKNDVLYLGSSGLMLIPCCDQAFNWRNLLTPAT